MQQTDSGSLAPVYGGNRKLTCDSFADGDIPHSTVVELPSDFPPDSFWLSKDAEFDWFDHNVFLQRKESTKGISNSKNLNPNVNTTHSQRYNSVKLKSKAAIIGLPKTQKTTYVDSKRRQCNPVNVRLFPKRSNLIGKDTTTVLVTEPSSPKVSCIGRVRSKRCRGRKKSSEIGSQSLKSTSQRSGSSRKQKAGLISRLTSLFRSDGIRRRKNGKITEKVKEPLEMSVSRRVCVTVKPIYSEPATPSEPLGLGGMMGFASGRRSEFWGGSDDVDDVAGCHSMDFARRI